jgi:hypothetical protein
VPSVPVHRVISTFLIKRSGRKVKSGAQSGAVTLIQRCGSALNLILHFHMLYPNGVYDTNVYFWPVKPPTPEYLDFVPDEEDAMRGIIGASITYRLVFGPNAGLCVPEVKP